MGKQESRHKRAGWIQEPDVQEQEPDTKEPTEPWAGMGAEPPHPTPRAREGSGQGPEAQKKQKRRLPLTIAASGGVQIRIQRKPEGHHVMFDKTAIVGREVKPSYKKLL